MKLKFRAVFWTAAAVVLAVLLALAFRPQAVAVDLAEVSRGPMRVTVRDEGRTRVRNEYVVAAPVGGLLHAVQVRPGAEALIENWSGGTADPLSGRVRLVEPYGFLKISALGVEEQRVNVIVDFTGPREQWASLGHGFRVEAAIVTWQGDDVIQAPVAALFRNRGRWAVFRVENGRARLTPVEIGHDNGRTPRSCPASRRASRWCSIRARNSPTASA